MGHSQCHLFSHLYCQLCFQIFFFTLPFFDPLSDHVGSLSRFQRLPEVFNGGVCLLNSGFESLNRSGVAVCFAGGGYSSRDSLNVAIG